MADAKHPAYTKPAAFFQIPFMLFIACGLWRIPAPGLAVTVLGVAAVIMAVRANRFTRAEEVLWIVIGIALCVVEIGAIRHDRMEVFEAQQKLRKEENEKFAALLEEGRKQFNATVAQSQTQFTATMNRSSAIMGGISDSIKITTGGDSFAYIRFYSSMVQGQAILIIAHHGKYPLKEIDLTLTDNGKMKSAIQEVQKQHPNLDSETSSLIFQAISGTQVHFRVPYLSPNRRQPIGTYPFPDKDENDFTIGFAGANGLWNERIHLRRIDGNWLQAISVIGPTPDSVKHPFEEVDKGYPDGQGIGRRDWPLASDVLRKTKK